MIVQILCLLRGVYLKRSLAGKVQDDWIKPAQDEVITNGEELAVSWSTALLESFARSCSECNTTRVDLCLQPDGNRNFDMILESRCH